MRVLLTRPFNKFSYSFTPPLGLGYLASMLKLKGGHDVFLCEAIRDKISTIDSFYNFLSHVKPGVVGIQVYSVDLATVKGYLRCIKAYNPQIITVIGGPHPSALPDETMDYLGPDLDFIIVGEGEQAFLSLVNMIAEGGASWHGIPGLVWRNRNGEIVKNAKESIRDIDKLPWPDWELLKPTLYPHAPQGVFAKRFPNVPIAISRGCPMRCNFCTVKSVYGNGFRYRNIDNVIAEIKYLVKRFGVKEIIIQDDNFTFKKSAVLEFCDKVSSLNILWNCNNGIQLNSIDDEVVKAMKEAGCYAVAVGIESGSQRILNDMNKDLNISQIEEKVNLLAKYKMRITGQFIIGYPTETRKDILDTIEFSKRLPIERGGFASFSPFPGSQIFFDLKKDRQLDDLDFGDMSYYKVVKSFSPHLSKKEVDILLKKAILLFHLRPLILSKILLNLGSFSNFWNIVRRFIGNYT